MPAGSWTWGTLCLAAACFLGDVISTTLFSPLGKMGPSIPGRSSKVKTMLGQSPCDYFPLKIPRRRRGGTVNKKPAGPALSKLAILEAWAWAMKNTCVARVGSHPQHWCWHGSKVFQDFSAWEPDVPSAERSETRKEDRRVILPLLTQSTHAKAAQGLSISSVLSVPWGTINKFKTSLASFCRVRLCSSVPM